MKTSWKKDGDWKARYSKLYTSSRRESRSNENQPSAISFLSYETKPYTPFVENTLTRQEIPIRRGSAALATDSSDLNTLLSNHSGWNSISTLQIDSLSEKDTLLLDLIRGKSRETNKEFQDKSLELDRDDVSEAQSSEVCMNGINMRMTDRSMSRRSMSRMSRVSARRDMDIPSILAFSAALTPAPAPLEIPAFQKVNTNPEEDLLKWSIRRSNCPVCSQKWRDKSSINIIKYSGLKRHFPSDLPSVIAPARLRSSITTEYTPRPVLTVVDENKPLTSMKNSGPAWQLTRARRFRAPKPQIPTLEPTEPCATAPMALKDLDIRVNKFLKDEGIEQCHRKSSFNYYQLE